MAGTTRQCLSLTKGEAAWNVAENNRPRSKKRAREDSAAAPMILLAESEPEPATAAAERQLRVARAFPSCDPSYLASHGRCDLF